METPSNITCNRKLNFCIGGAQKASTTALCRYLQQHPSIFIPLKKELHVFNRPLDLPWERRRESDAGISSYFGMAKKGQLCGECTPAYLYWPDSFKLANEHNPKIKIIICLRNPVIRAYSAWRMEVGRGRETLSFHEAIRGGRTRVAEAPQGFHKIYSYVERGFYAEQIQNLFKIFPRNQIHFVKSEDIRAESPALQAILSFLEIPSHGFFPLRKNLFQNDVSKHPDSLTKDLSFLQELYADDMHLLSTLLDLDFSGWLKDAPTSETVDWSYEQS